jgi:hypothetical protein
MEGLPPWAQQFTQKYYSQTIAMFVLTGNVHDLVPLRGPKGTQFVPLNTFLNEAMFGRRDIVLGYDRGYGISFAKPDTQKDFSRALEGYDSFHGTRFAQGLPRNPDSVLSLLGSYLRLRIADSKKIALVIHFAETIAPAGDVSGMSTEDRNSLVILKRWAQDTSFLRSDVTICLVAENGSELNQGILQNPAVSAISVPLPDEQERLEFVRAQLQATPLPEGSDVSESALAHLTAGAEAHSLANHYPARVREQGAAHPQVPHGAQERTDRGRIRGMLEFVQSRFNLSMVAGHAPAKRKTERSGAVAAVRADRMCSRWATSSAVRSGQARRSSPTASRVKLGSLPLC